jgi:Signal transduction histidine kinase
MMTWNAKKIGLGMLNIIGLVVLYMPSFFTVRAQNLADNYSDSLLNIVRKAPTDALKIDGLLKISFFWSDRDTTKAYSYLNDAKTLMDKRPSSYYWGLYHQFLANILMEYDYEEAKRTFLKADAYLKNETTRNAFLNRSKIWNNYAMILQKQDRHDEYLKVTIDQSLPLARLAGDSSSVAYQLNNIGRQLENIHDYRKAENYYKQALNAIAKVQNASENKLEIFTNAARNAAHRLDLSETRMLLDSACVYAKRIPHSTYIPYLHVTEGIYYRHLNQKEKSLSSLQQAIEAAKESDDEYGLQNAYQQLSLTFKAFGDYRQAKESLQESMRHQSFENLHNTLIYQRDMARLEFLLGDYRTAYLEMEAFADGLDSLHDREVALKVRELETRYKSVERENLLFKLEEENRKKQLALAAGLLLALCVAFFSWKLGKKNKNLLVQKELLHQEELRSIRQQERLGQFDAMLRGQEAERSRLAKDLHDGLGGLLAGVKLKLSAIITKAGESSNEEKRVIHDAVSQLDYSVDELRRIAHGMMPESLRADGLIPALSDLCRIMSTSTVRVTFQDLGIKDNYPDQLRITVYRVVQELLTNAIKHAHADKVILQCSELENWLFVTVEDNGIGMDLTTKDQQKGLGLVNIQHRIALLDGQMEILSRPGEGTTVNIQIAL